MDSMDGIFAGVAHLRKVISTESMLPENLATTADEIKEARAAKATARAHVASIISILRVRLDAQASLAEAVDSPPSYWMAEKPPMAREFGITDELEVAEELMTAEKLMTAQKLTTAEEPMTTAEEPAVVHDMNTLVVGSTAVVQRLTASIGGVFDGFNKALEIPGLKDIYGNLNTMPVIGLQGRDLMFIDKYQGGVDAWAKFCLIPDGAETEGQRVLMFPYNTDLYFCCGQKAWKKTFNPNFIAPTTSPYVAWKEHYEAQWVPVADNIIPDEIKAVVPLVLYDQNTDVMSTGLASLTSEGKLQYTQQRLENGSKFTEMTCKSKNTPSKYKHIAFLNGLIMAISDDDKLWQLQPTAQGTYASLSSTPVKPSIDRLIATEEGLIAQIGPDLYGCVPQVIPVESKDAETKTKFEWTKLIAAGDIMTTCAASPGVFMNFEILIRSLQRRYREGQKGLVPVVVKLSSFARNHITHLELLQSDSKQDAAFDKIISDSQRSEEEVSKATLSRDALLKEAKARFIAHCKYSHNEVSKGATNCRRSIAFMKKEFNAAEADVDSSIQRLHDELVKLQVVLGSEKLDLQRIMDQEEEARTVFWVLIGVGIVALIVGIIGLFFPPAWALVGLYSFVVVSYGVAAFKYTTWVETLTADRKNLELRIADHKNQIGKIEKTMAEFGTIKAAFHGIEGHYDDILNFWSGMTGGLATSEEIDKEASRLMGNNLLSGPSILTSLKATNDLKDACDAYVTVLAAHGLDFKELSDDEHGWEN